MRSCPYAPPFFPLICARTHCCCVIEIDFEEFSLLAEACQHSLTATIVCSQHIFYVSRGRKLLRKGFIFRTVLSCSFSAGAKIRSVHHTVALNVVHSEANTFTNRQMDILRRLHI